MPFSTPKTFKRPFFSPYHFLKRVWKTAVAPGLSVCIFVSVCLEMKYKRTPLRHLGLHKCVCALDEIRYAAKANRAVEAACELTGEIRYSTKTTISLRFIVPVCLCVLADKIRYTSKTIPLLGVIVGVWVYWQPKKAPLHLKGQRKICGYHVCVCSWEVADVDIYLRAFFSEVFFSGRLGFLRIPPAHLKRSLQTITDPSITVNLPQTNISSQPPIQLWSSRSVFLDQICMTAHKHKSLSCSYLRCSMI